MNFSGWMTVQANLPKVENLISWTQINPFRCLNWWWSKALVFPWEAFSHSFKSGSERKGEAVFIVLCGSRKSNVPCSMSKLINITYQSLPVLDFGFDYCPFALQVLCIMLFWLECLIFGFEWRYARPPVILSILPVRPMAVSVFHMLTDKKFEKGAFRKEVG